MINAEVIKSGSENALSTIRKFTRRVQGAGIVKTTRAGRYYSRSTSPTVKKKRALKLIARREEFAQLLKEGKVQEKAPIRGPRAPIATTSTTPDATSPTATASTTSAPTKMDGAPIAR